MTVGQRIQQLRLTLALSQEEFGERLGVSRQTVSKWELDQTLPELSKIVMMARLFSVTTDYLLVDGITSFDIENNDFNCQIMRSELTETVETEKYALVYYSNADKSTFGVKLYVGYRNKKLLRAVCERDNDENKTKYTYLTAENTLCHNDENTSKLLGTKFVRSPTATRRESFQISRNKGGLPKVSEVGILKALQSWRMCAKLTDTVERFSFSLCTQSTEYIFSIDQNGENIYCGASFNRVFDLGLYCAGQYFRIRHYKDNTEPFCGFGCDFSFVPRSASVPTDKCDLSACQNDKQSNIFTVKRYSDDEIVLSGCGGDEYIYRKDDKRNEIFSE